MFNHMNTPSLRITWADAPWDQAVCGFPVLQITAIKVLGANADKDLQIFERERDRIGARLVSCRLSHECMTESILLEDHGFRFIEMLYQPELEMSTFDIDTHVASLEISRAGNDDLPALQEIARTCFHNERFKIDPRLDPAASDQRYMNWVVSSLTHPSQELYAIREGKMRIAFFVTEMLNDGTCYWHLNAIANDAQGKGYGRKIWMEMLSLASKSGARRVRTSIVARNHRVLNLYARLGFNFPPPSMTFHWVRPQK